jgi:hypothetical protein
LELNAGRVLYSFAIWSVLQDGKTLHRKDAKSAKKRKREKERKKEGRKASFIAKNRILSLAFVFLCVLRVFAVQGFSIYLLPFQRLL